MLESTSHNLGVATHKIHIDAVGCQFPASLLFLDMFGGGATPLVEVFQTTEGLVHRYLQGILTIHDVHQRVILPLHRRLQGSGPVWGMDVRAAQRKVPCDTDDDAEFSLSDYVFLRIARCVRRN